MGEDAEAAREAVPTLPLIAVRVEHGLQGLALGGVVGVKGQAAGVDVGVDLVPGPVDHRAQPE